MLLKVKLGDRLIGIGFSHPLVVTRVKVAGHKVPIEAPQRQSHCLLFELIEGSPEVKEIAHGQVSLYYRDQFNKEEGRKRSLADALDAGGFTREDRAEIWRQYLGRRHPVTFLYLVKGASTVKETPNAPPS